MAIAIGEDVDPIREEFGIDETCAVYPFVNIALELAFVLEVVDKAELLDIETAPATLMPAFVAPLKLRFPFWFFK